jgi:hypothetical protein
MSNNLSQILSTLQSDPLSNESLFQSTLQEFGTNAGQQEEYRQLLNASEEGTLIIQRLLVILDTDDNKLLPIRSLCVRALGNLSIDNPPLRSIIAQNDGLNILFKHLELIPKFCIGAICNVVAETPDLQEKLLETDKLKEIVKIFNKSIENISNEYSKLGDDETIHSEEIKESIESKQVDISMEDILICKLTIRLFINLNLPDQYNQTINTVAQNAFTAENEQITAEERQILLEKALSRQQQLLQANILSSLVRLCHIFINPRSDRDAPEDYSLLENSLEFFISLYGQHISWIRASNLLELLVDFAKTSEKPQLQAKSLQFLTYLSPAEPEICTFLATRLFSSNSALLNTAVECWLRLSAENYAVSALINDKTIEKLYKLTQNTENTIAQGAIIILSNVSRSKIERLALVSHELFQESVLSTLKSANINQISAVLQFVRHILLSPATHGHFLQLEELISALFELFPRYCPAEIDEKTEISQELLQKNNNFLAILANSVGILRNVVSLSVEITAEAQAESKTSENVQNQPSLNNVDAELASIHQKLAAFLVGNENFPTIYNVVSVKNERIQLETARFFLSLLSSLCFNENSANLPLISRVLQQQNVKLALELVARSKFQLLQEELLRAAQGMVKWEEMKGILEENEGLIEAVEALSKNEQSQAVADEAKDLLKSYKDNSK